MFVKYEVDVANHLVPGDNELRIYFKSALLIGRELEKNHKKGDGFNGETSRMYIRKAQYHYGWDWGPLYMTCGPYRPVKFISYDSSIDDVYVKVSVGDDLNASIDVQSEVSTDDKVVILVAAISPTSGEFVHTSSTTAINGTNSIQFDISKPDLWFPFSHGTPHLYDFIVTISKDNTVLHEITKRVGLRKVELVQEPYKDQEGTSFYFRVNGVPIYSAGSNWIPAHSFQTSLTKQDYTDWLQLMVDGHQNMIRLWGGGYYEQDIFYEECDRLGILIWHDFMFACGIYPAHKEFVENVSKEVKSQLKRIRNHCSLAVFVGNNEDYMVAEQLKLKWDDKTDYESSSFPARAFYEDVFPTLIEELYPEVPYHRGSPYGGKDSQDPTVGDIHQWNVWHGQQEKYQNWYKLGGRFVSEFGMEALPSRKTYEQCITDPSELYPQSYLVDFHNRSDGFERRLALYVMENIKVEGLDLDSWIYATQLMQSECLGYAYRCWRREWRGDGKRYAGGAIVWQINDCWPVASWAIADFYKRPKLAYYSVKRESQPLGVGMYRNENKDYDPIYDEAGDISPPFDYRKVHLTVDIWGVNSGLKDVDGTLQIQTFNVSTGEKLESLPDQKVTLKANQTTEFKKDMKISDEEPVVVYSKIVDSSGKILASAGDWPQPLKYLKFPNRSVDIQVKDDEVILKSDKPVKGVEITLESDLFIDDNGFDLFPGDTKVVEIKGLKSSDKVSLNWYQKSR